MEELRSTEILDKEIQEDARKKAGRILRDADAEAAKILAAVDSRVAAIRKEKENAYEQKIAAFKRDAEAALPLEEKRFLVSFEGNAVCAAINSYLKNLAAEKRLELLDHLLVRAATVIAGKQVNAEFFGIPQKAALLLLQKRFGSGVQSCTEIAFEKTGLAGISGIDIHEGMVLETADRQIRCRITLDELVSNVLNESREELTRTLFSGRLPQ